MTTSGQASTFDVVDGVRLGYCYVDQVAREVGARALAIKGPIPAALGLWPEKVSVDVDVLVAPDDHAALVAGLTGLGWESIDRDEEFRLFPFHSVTLAHPAWPMTVDIHQRFPGFLVDPATAFERLWEDRTSASVAGRRICSAGMAGSTLIAALHALRDPGRESSVSELDHLTAAWSSPDRSPNVLAALAAATGSGQSAAPLLMRLGVTVPGLDESMRPAFEEWMLRSSAGTSSGVGWIRSVVAAPWYRRPGVVWRGVTAHRDSALRQEGLPSDGSGRLRARIRRFRRVVRTLPHALRLAHEHRLVLRRLARGEGRHTGGRAD